MKCMHVCNVCNVCNVCIYVMHAMYVVASVEKIESSFVLVFAAPQNAQVPAPTWAFASAPGVETASDRVSTPIWTSRGRPPLAGSRLRWGAGGGGATGSSGRSSQRSLILEQTHQKGMPGGALRCIPRVAHPMKESSVAP